MGLEGGGGVYKKSIIISISTKTYLKNALIKIKKPLWSNYYIISKGAFYNI